MNLQKYILVLLCSVFAHATYVMNETVKIPRTEKCHDFNSLQLDDGYRAIQEYDVVAFAVFINTRRGYFGHLRDHEKNSLLDVWTSEWKKAKTIKKYPHGNRFQLQLTQILSMLLSSKH